jgi:O-methyltransferase involved in polyketide biosynthesis
MTRLLVAIFFLALFALATALAATGHEALPPGRFFPLRAGRRGWRHGSRLFGVNAPVKVELTGVPETALWNLYQRASAARAGHLEDPRAVEVLGRLDYPFERFDAPYQGLAARLHALRVRTMDGSLRRALADAPDATVVALGEGFETQFWRVDDGQLRWLTLDLPDVVAVRREVLPDGPRNRTLAGSAADTQWTAQVDRERPVIITAQGLLPYFERDEVHRLLTAWAGLLPGAWLLFDAVTPALQALRGRNPLPDGYRPPDWTWTVDADELRRIRELPGVNDLHEVPLAGGDRLLAALRRVPGLKSQLVTLPVFLARLGRDVRSVPRA